TKGTVYSDPTTDNLFELFKQPKSVLWVAEVNNNVMGCCGIYPTEGLKKDCVELVKFYIGAESRGKGIGKLLMEKCIETAKDFNYTQMYIESLPEFNKAISIYEKSGFKKIKKPLGNSGHSGCNIWMLKDL
ncbi:MAG: GNAT family N-acetyltransferase, partial [Bacteroidia bacterium]|nr:GNAT family N-acetyltransferase [Bacteroidia bacterium]